MNSFDMIWDRLADAGKCDARGGVEYERVRSSFVAMMNRPSTEKLIEAFIVKHANLGPDATD